MAAAWDRQQIYRKAEKLRAKRKYKRALREYIKIIDSDPDDLKVQNRLAELYKILKLPEQAIPYYESVANSFMQEERWDKAISLYRQIIELDRHCIQRYEDLARVFVAKDLKADAIHLYKEALPWFRRRKWRVQFVDLHGWILELDPYEHSIRFDLAKLLRRCKRSEEAIALISKGIELLQGSQRRKWLRRYRWQLFRLQPSWGRFWALWRRSR